ncbi:MAG: 2-amino-4-hydroxy-6-hydroxymethyldihydropteridine diphosphokinase [Pseudomonadota bacterium]
MTEFPTGAEFDAVIAVGSNIGDKAQNIETATQMVCDAEDVELVTASQIYKTPPWGVTDQDWFANACFSVRTSLQPHALLGWCLDVERKMGRERTVKWGPRVIDLDVLVYRNAVLSDEILTLPHPHITERAFVLVPLIDVAPDLILNGARLDHWLSLLDQDGIDPLQVPVGA